jgi:hypothetical protein
MYWRIGLVMAVVGIGLFVWGGVEMSLSRGASEKPEKISLEKLLARGAEGNPNIILTDFELGDNYVYEKDSKTSRWTGVYVPAVPADPSAPPGAPARPGAIKAVIYSTNVHSEADVEKVLDKPELPGMVTNRIKSLGSQEKKLLKEQYGGDIDVDKCLIIQEGRTPFSGGGLAAIFGGGALLLLGGLGVIVLGIVQGRRGSADQVARRRRRDLDEDDERPRRRRVYEEDEEDEPRRRSRPRGEDE